MVHYGSHHLGTKECEDTCCSLTDLGSIRYGGWSVRYSMLGLAALLDP